MLRLITDFDGPIVDVSERYYQVYQLCLAKNRSPEQEVKQLSKEDFWALKRSRVPETQIARLSGLNEDQAKAFAQMRRDTVHTLPYLGYDCLQPKAIPALELARQAGIEVIVMTMRRVKELQEMFDRTNLEQFFSKRYCLSNDYQKTGDTKDKPLLMGRAVQELPPADQVWMVGDTEADVIAAKTHGIKVIAVLCGIRDHDQLAQYEPDLILEDIYSAVEYILTKS